MTIDNLSINYLENSEHDFEERILPRLKLYGKEIGQDADDGNEIAKKIISLYTMLAKRFEQASCGLLQNALNQWIKEKGKDNI